MMLMLNAIDLPDNASFESMEPYLVYRAVVMLLEKK